MSCCSNSWMLLLFPTSCCCRLMFCTDKRSKAKFLVDSGSEVSVLPRSMATDLDAGHLRFKLKGTCDHPIRPYGTRKLKITLNEQNTFIWTFIVADVSIPIIGLDFPATFRLAVMPFGNKLINCMNHTEINCSRTNESSR